MTVMIDIIVIICLVWALILGIKRGFVAQLCHLIGLYMALLIAPKYATEVGALVMDDPGKAYLAGFIIIVAAAAALVWIIAPLIKAIIIWRPMKGIDALLGALLNVALTVVIISALFSIFDRINISPNIRQEALAEIVESHSEGDIRQRVTALSQADIDGEMRQYFEHKYVDYATLEESICFYPLAELGTKLIPSIRFFDETIRQEAERAINEQIFFNF